MALDTFLVLAMRTYKFEDKETKRAVEGATIMYLDPDSAIGNRDGEEGVFPIKCAALPKIAVLIRSLPAFVELDFKQRPGPDGKATLTLVDVGDQFPISLHEIPQLGKVGAKS